MKSIYKTAYKLTLGLCLALCINSCSLDEYNPAALSEGDVLTTFEGWKSYQSNCYSALWGSLIGMPYGLVSELGTDLWTFPYNNHGTYKEILAYENYANDVNVVRNTWDFAFGPIKDCNKVIQLSEGLKDGNPADIAILTAEAHFLRAYFYSVLVAQFGEVPLVTEGDPTKSLTPERNSIPEIYTQILRDLRHAFNTLPAKPYDENPQRVTKKAALGIMARVYAQGAGEGLSEGSKSYWVRAKEVADSLITYKSAYDATLYDDFAKVFAAANNRNNAEVLFTAYGLDPYNVSFNYASSNTKPNLYLHYYPKLDEAFGTTDVFLRGVNKNTTNAYYGRCNQQFVAPTKYLIDCFNADYDKRWENTFVTAYTNYSGVQAINGGSPAGPANVTYAKATVEITQAIANKYNLDPSHIGKKIYPYIDVNSKLTDYNATYQYVSQVWNKGAHSGNVAELSEPANANVHPYPLAADEDRFFVYLSKAPLTDAEKKARAYITINIDDMFDPSDASGSTYKGKLSNNGFTPVELITVFPAMMKFNHNFDGGWLGGNFQQKLGNIMVMRMAEVYLIAAEATLNSGGSAAEAAAYLNVLRERACRNAADFNTSTGMKLSSASMNDVFDEYARELCGEYYRWALLKRNKAFEGRLQKYNQTAFKNFVPAKHYNRPIPRDFLNKINNPEEFGNNGY
ncbi:RagB/SusD family nutrient uptake outer membrane protein [Bacteroides sp. 214]|uniref:RagB/SusD family nutrient uptake outer membrane protein n=1 Tax=Bacteroides sp. 214 TaxID=2302935 RepID=UPI0013CF96AC|nr:RagB/SusD family nutrient uptake outer membrane protein [Bacteroides sp. 214]NDW13349.1 RagB/SusD family nutrient uptake outer membrane protein [Bacteroides sp. 214]